MQTLAFISKTTKTAFITQNSSYYGKSVSVLRLKALTAIKAGSQETYGAAITLLVNAIDFDVIYIDGDKSVAKAQVVRDGFKLLHKSKKA